MVSASTPALVSLHLGLIGTCKPNLPLHDLVGTCKPNQPFFPELLFGHDIYHSNRKQIRAEITDICVCLHCSGSLDPRRTQYIRFLKGVRKSHKLFSYRCLLSETRLVVKRPEGQEESNCLVVRCQGC